MIVLLYLYLFYKIKIKNIRILVFLVPLVIFFIGFFDAENYNPLKGEGGTYTAVSIISLLVRIYFSYCMDEEMSEGKTFDNHQYSTTYTTNDQIFSNIIQR
jgi:hypothetical protein